MDINKNTYQAYSLFNFKKIPQIKRLSEREMFDIEVVSQVLPFKTNSYVVNELINWDNIPNDPIFILTFPQKEMLLPEHYETIANLLKKGANKKEISKVANDIRLQLNPHPAGQLDLNVPSIDGERINGMQHKYRETVLFFPAQGQTCHAYCTFCFRWPQFVGMDDMKFASKEADLMVRYIKEHKEVTNILFTGGDPMVMKARLLEQYINPLIENDLPQLKAIRIGTKALAYWPYRFTSDPDSKDILKLFEKITKSGKNISVMAHFNHPVELRTKAVKEAIWLIRSTGATIRTQSPLLKHINADSETWEIMWREQVRLGCIPYYMFLARDTGAQHYFNISLEEAYHTFRNAYLNVSGLCRTVRGPSMSASPGKIQVLGITEIMGEKVYMLRFIQGRVSDWVGKPFFAKYKKDAVWLSDLKPAFGEEKFFWQEEYETLTQEKIEAFLCM
ncbi:KamA family radical SAM protein [Bacteroidota bacterium]